MEWNFKTIQNKQILKHIIPQFIFKLEVKSTRSIKENLGKHS